MLTKTTPKNIKFGKLFVELLRFKCQTQRNFIIFTRFKTYNSRYNQYFFTQSLYAIGNYWTDFFETFECRSVNFILHNMLNFHILNYKILLVTNLFLNIKRR